MTADPADRTDFDNAERGLIARLEPGVVKAADGRLLLDFTASPVGDRIKRVVAEWDRNTRHPRHGSGDSSRRRDDDEFNGTSLPDTLKLKLSVRLADNTPKP